MRPALKESISHQQSPFFFAVGRTPWSADGPLAGLGRRLHEIDPRTEERVQGDPRGPGGPPHQADRNGKAKRCWQVIPTILCAFLVGCGSVGEPLYPALNIPTRSGDLTAVERGAKIDIRFSIPPRTTEGLVLKKIGGLELRVGPNTDPGFNADAWATGAKRIDVPLPEQAGPVQVEIPAAEFFGKEVVVAVRVGNSKGRMSAWSNIVIVSIEQPLATPVDFKAEPVAEGVRLTWTAPNQSAFRIYRKVAPEKEPSLLAESDKPEYVDTNTEYGKTYEYYVQGVHAKTESELTGPKSVKPVDIFPPGVPAGLTASVGIGAVELAWNRNTEPDFKQYRVYRSGEGGLFVQIADSLESPNYSDRKVESGKHYRYRVTAADQTGNESKPSEVIEATAP